MPEGRIAPRSACRCRASAASAPAVQVRRALHACSMLGKCWQWRTECPPCADVRDIAHTRVIRQPPEPAGDHVRPTKGWDPTESPLEPPRWSDVAARHQGRADRNPQCGEGDASHPDAAATPLRRNESQGIPVEAPRRRTMGIGDGRNGTRLPIHRKRCERTTLVFSLTPGRSSRAGVRGYAIAGGQRRSSPACS